MVTVQATGEVRANYANHHLNWAFAAARNAFEIENVNANESFGAFYDDLSREVHAAILFSASSLEAWVNEIGADAERNFPAQPAYLVEAAIRLGERQTLEDKIRLLASLRQGVAPNFGNRAGQGIAPLIALRNALVHYRPAFAEGARHEPLSRILSGRFRSSRHHPNQPLFPTAFVTYDCARWACECVRDFLREYGEANGWAHPTSKQIWAERHVLPPSL